MKVGIVGLGNVGTAIAHNLAESGTDADIYLYNRTRKKRDLFANSRTSTVSLSMLVSQCDVLITAITDGQALDKLLIASGLFKQMKRGSIHICVSTIAPKEALELTTLHQHQGHFFVAAPILGRSDKIKSRQAMMLLAGSSDIKKSITPLIQNLGFDSSVDLGESVDVPFKVKLCLNFFMAGVLQTLGESFSLAEGMSLPVKDLCDILTTSPLDSKFLRAYGPSILQEEFYPAKFSLSLALKDMRLVQDSIQDGTHESPLLNLLLRQLEDHRSFGRGHLDWAALSQLKYPVL